MRHATLVSAAIIAGLLTLPAAGRANCPVPAPIRHRRPKGLAARTWCATWTRAQKRACPRTGRAERRPAAAQQAEPATPPPAPYTALAVAPPKPSTDASLAAFRKDLVAIAQKKDRAALAKLVLAKDFFWMKEEGTRPARGPASTRWRPR